MKQNEEIQKMTQDQIEKMMKWNQIKLDIDILMIELRQTQDLNKLYDKEMDKNKTKIEELTEYKLKYQDANPMEIDEKQEMNENQNNQKSAENAESDENKDNSMNVDSMNNSKMEESESEIDEEMNNDKERIEIDLCSESEQETSMNHDNESTENEEESQDKEQKGNDGTHPFNFNQTHSRFNHSMSDNEWRMNRPSMFPSSSFGGFRASSVNHNINSTGNEKQDQGQETEQDGLGFNHRTTRFDHSVSDNEWNLNQDRSRMELFSSSSFGEIRAKSVPLNGAKILRRSSEFPLSDITTPEGSFPSIPMSNAPNSSMFNHDFTKTKSNPIDFNM